MITNTIEMNAIGDNKIAVSMPFNKEFPDFAQNNGGIWDADKQAWIFGKENREQVVRKCVELYSHGLADQHQYDNYDAMVSEMEKSMTRALDIEEALGELYRHKNNVLAALKASGISDDAQNDIMRAVEEYSDASQTCALSLAKIKQQEGSLI